MRVVEVTIEQTETFTFFMVVPDNASLAEAREHADDFLDAPNILEASRENGDCSTHISEVQEADMSAKQDICFVNNDGFIDWKSL